MRGKGFMYAAAWEKLERQAARRAAQDVDVTPTEVDSLLQHPTIILAVAS